MSDANATPIDWLTMARVVRGQVLSLKHEQFVEAARCIGVSNAGIVLRHILPNTLAAAIVIGSLELANIIVVEASLSFLGLGVQAPTPSWGNMLAALQRYHVLSSYWWMWAPGLALVPVFLAYSALSEALQSRVGPASP